MVPEYSGILNNIKSNDVKQYINYIDNLNILNCFKYIYSLFFKRKNKNKYFLQFF